jgi:hypothetical protein
LLLALEVDSRRAKQDRRTALMLFEAINLKRAVSSCQRSPTR